MNFFFNSSESSVTAFCLRSSFGSRILTITIPVRSRTLRQTAQDQDQQLGIRDGSRPPPQSHFRVRIQLWLHMRTTVTSSVDGCHRGKLARRFAHMQSLSRCGVRSLLLNGDVPECATRGITSRFSVGSRFSAFAHSLSLAPVLFLRRAVTTHGHY